MRKQQGMLVLAIIILFISCSKSNEYDLAIRNVDIFDSEKGEILKNKTIIINSDIIVSIISADQKVDVEKEIEGSGRLVTAGHT